MISHIKPVNIDEVEHVSVRIVEVRVEAGYLAPAARLRD